MSKFSHLERFQPSVDKTVAYRLFQIEGEPILHMKQATDANKPYWNGVLRRNSAAVRRLRGGNLNAAVLEETRDNDRELFAKHVVTGWEKVVDTDGQPVVFSQEDCLEFLRALPNWVFDDVRSYAADAQNFVEDSTDSEALSGN